MRIIREAKYTDIDALLAIFNEARRTIAELGIDQWQNGYPNREVIEQDIENGEGYVLELDGEVVAAFAMLKGEEPTYSQIYDGSWLSGEKDAYTAIHRFAITPACRGIGIAKDILDFAACQSLSTGKGSLRIDTHEGNVVMRRMLEKNGFLHVGRIYLESGDARVAYEKILTPILSHYRDQACAFLQQNLENNIAYSVLYRILATKCNHIFTNYKDIIVCHSNPPYPVWVWSETANEQTAALISSCLKENFPHGSGVILSEELLSHLGVIDPVFACAQTKMELLAYRLDTLVPPPRPTTGKMELADLADLELLALYRQRMSYEMEGFTFSIEECREKMRELISQKRLFVWRDRGKIVSTTSLEPCAPYAKIAAVYTSPEHRRRGYAIHLVHDTCAVAQSQGLTPILYTDGGYAASNAAYQKIGFRRVSRLLNIVL